MDLEIRKASDEYIGYSEEVDEGISTGLRRDAFRDGALWYKNNHKLHWYKPNEYPDKGLTVLCVYGTGYCDATEIVGNTQWDVMVEELNIVKWCYFQDILRLSE